MSATLTLNPNVRIDPPARLPVGHLSYSSLKLFAQCPEQWRREKLEHEYRPPSGKMLLGGAAGAALAQHYGHQINSGEGLSTERVLDEFDKCWERRVDREAEVNWEKDTRGALKDSGAACLELFHRRIAPSITPVSIEREFRFGWPGVEWLITGYIDVEDIANRVRDMKMGKRVSQADADADLQADIYLAARRAEGNPAAGFCFDQMIRNKTPVVDITHTSRTEDQLDLLTERIFRLACELDWRCSTGIWSGAPPKTWFCGNCTYDCPLRLGIR